MFGIVSQVFQNNMQLLAKYQPNISAYYQEYAPSNISRTEHPHNDLLIGSELFYGFDSAVACSQQVSHFFKHPCHFSLNLKQTNRQAAHQQAINHLNQKANSLLQAGYKRPRPKTNLLVLGTGTGEFLPLMCENMDVRQILVVEPDKDMLFHFLGSTDISDLLNKCTLKDSSISFMQPGSLEDFEKQFKKYLESSGFDFLADVTLYRHYETPLFDKIIDSFREIRGRLLSSWGFFEDETQGLKHTLQNLSLHSFAKLPCSQALSELNSLPLVIVGNGPSLDKEITLLKHNQNKFCVMSCGTALASLLNNGITPDIHVEMERNLFTAMIQQPWLESPELKNTTLFALSTVSPNTTNKFKQCLLFTKASDLGSYYINNSGSELVKELTYCNPTVTNFALASAIRVGFNSIFLLGCDYGFRDKSKHHSSSSDYFSQKSSLRGVNFKNEIVTEDNFGRPFYTTRIFDISRRNLETLLSSHSKVSVKNCSDGAKIIGANYLSFSEVCSLHAVSNINFNNLYTHLTDIRENNLIPNLTFHISELKSIVKDISGRLTLNCAPEEGLKRLRAVNQHIQKKFREDFVYILFLGDFRYLALLISGHLNRIKPDKINEYWQDMPEVFNTMIDKYESELNSILEGE